MNILLIFLSVWQALTYEVMFAINCGSYTHTMIATKFFNYTTDTYFQGLASTIETKNNIPDSITNQADKQLIKLHRTSSQGYTNFSYRPIISENGYYMAIITMVQTQLKLKGERIFHIKLGDEIVHTVDIVAQAGFGKILHKWIQLDLREDIAFLNGTLPALNAFNFKTRQVRIVFEGIKNKPKIQALMFIKGTDSHQYLKQFLQHQQEKSVKIKQYVAEKYRKQPKLSYRPLLASDIIMPPQSELQKFYNKFVTLRSFGSIVCGIMAVHFQKILKILRNKFMRVIQGIKSINQKIYKKGKKE